MREITRTQISFADLEVGRRVRLDPLLQQISDFLDRPMRSAYAGRRPMRDVVVVIAVPDGAAAHGQRIGAERDFAFAVSFHQSTRST